MKLPIVYNLTVFVNKDDSQKDFKNRVFKIIVTNLEYFELKELDNLLKIINELSFIHNNEYEIKFNSHTFKIKALNKTYF